METKKRVAVIQVASGRCHSDPGLAPSTLGLHLCKYNVKLDLPIKEIVQP